MHRGPSVWILQLISSSISCHACLICGLTCWWFYRNRDFQEVTLERDGETLLQFAAVYGFRNIQTLVHRMRKGRVPYQLVEVLSCPGGNAKITNTNSNIWIVFIFTLDNTRNSGNSVKCYQSAHTCVSCVPSGCLSGRGQAESEAGGRVDKVLVQQMEEAYCSLPVRLPELNPTLHTLYQDWLQGQDSSQTSKLLHTQYRTQSQTHTQPPHMQWWREPLLRHDGSQMRTAGLIGSESHDHLIVHAGTVKDSWWTTLYYGPVSEKVQVFNLATGGWCLYFENKWILCQTGVWAEIKDQRPEKHT